MTLRLHATLLGFLALSASGCNHHVYSPPARVLPIETARAAKEGATGVALEAGPSGALFGPELWSGTARVRRALAPRTDLAVEATVIGITSEGEGETDTHRGVYAARVGAKHELVKHLAVVGGLGGGASAAGGFVSPDAGAVVAWENPYVVPFLSARGYASQPIGATRVQLGTDDVDGSPITGRPALTLGMSLNAGVRIPVGPRHAETGAIGVALGVTGMQDGVESETFSSGAVGGEVWF